MAVAIAVSLAMLPVASAEDEAAATTTTTMPAVAPVAPSGPTPTFTPVKRYDVVRNLVFPVVGVSAYHASFGACRDGCTREHHGVDISTYGYKGLPVVAAHDGVVTKVTYDEGNPGCSVRIRGADKWETRYYHLNNDIPGTDEIGAACPAPGIEVGVTVRAGQIIGYMGDSGNGENTTAHLHFELRNRTGYPIDPYRSLDEADRIEFEWLPTDPQAATLLISAAVDPASARTVSLIAATDLDELGASEEGVTMLAGPLVAVDPANPGAASMEIQRLAPERIIAMSDEPHGWLDEMARPMAPIVVRSDIPRPPEPGVSVHPDGMDPEPFVFNPPDRFPIVIGGAVDRIHRSRQPAYETFIHDHRVTVVESERWAPRRIGVETWTTPGRRADPSLLWWVTGDGWVGTETIEDAPDPGIAYVRERMVRDYTLNFLASLAELPPYPVWKSS